MHGQNFFQEISYFMPFYFPKVECFPISPYSFFIQLVSIQTCWQKVDYSILYGENRTTVCAGISRIRKNNITPTVWAN
jgi:hypothetical protein